MSEAASGSPSAAVGDTESDLERDKRSDMVTLEQVAFRPATLTRASLLAGFVRTGVADFVHRTGLEGSVA